MITEFFLNIIFDFVMGIMDVIPVFDFIIPTQWVSFVQDACSVIFYMLPMSTLKSIFVLVFALAIVRIVISLIHAVWGLLPIK